MEKKFYLCKKCGNVVFKAVDSGIVPFCCGQEMTELVAKTTDMASEKHVPVVTQVDDCKMRVEVGSIAHPMTTEHHICFIYLETTDGGMFKWLNGNELPTATFPCKKEEFVAAYEYCNLHGLWMGNVISKPKDCGAMKGKKHLTFAFFCSLFSFFACQQVPQSYDNTPVSDLDLKRYMGVWYEIARYDHRFERDIDNTKALYALNEKGTVDVLNSGWKNGALKETKGWAKQPNASQNPGLLRVSFFRPFYSDYRVLMVGRDYDYAMVGSKSMNYLWFLSRTPQLPDSKRQTLMLEAEKRGYDIGRLHWIDQTANLKKAQRK